MTNSLPSAAFPPVDDKIFHGRRLPTGHCAITIETPDGAVLGSARHPALRSHVGFDWGKRDSSGAAETAECLLLACVPDWRCAFCTGTGKVVKSLRNQWRPAKSSDKDDKVEECWKCTEGRVTLPYHGFVRDFVSTWPDEWHLPRSAVTRWLVGALIADIAERF